MNIAALYDKCTDCGKPMSEILIPITDRKAIHEQEVKARLCRKCTKEQKHTDSVIDIELKKAAIIS